MGWMTVYQQVLDDADKLIQTLTDRDPRRRVALRLQENLRKLREEREREEQRGVD